MVLDSQAMLMPGDPLKPEYNERRNLLLQEYRLAGLCVIEVHHGGKSREQRGSSRNDDALDIQIRLGETPGWQAGDGLLFDLEYKKVRHDTRLTADYTVTFAGGEWKEVMSDAEVAVGDKLQQGMSTRQIADDLGISQSKVARMKQKITAAGLVQLNAKAVKAVAAAKERGKKG